MIVMMRSAAAEIRVIISPLVSTGTSITTGLTGRRLTRPILIHFRKECGQLLGGCVHGVDGSFEVSRDFGEISGGRRHG